MRPGRGVLFPRVTYCYFVAQQLRTPDTPDLNGVRGMLSQARGLGIPEETELLDGAHAAVDGGTGPGGERPTLADLAEWLESHEDMPGETLVSYGEEICVDAVVISADEIECSEHIGASPLKAIVTTHPDCAGHE